MSGMDETEGKLAGKLLQFAEVHGLEQLQTILGLLSRVKRKRRAVLGSALLVVKMCLLLLQVAGIGQHDRAQVNRGGRGIDRAVKTLSGQTRNVTGVVQMRVS